MTAHRVIEIMNIGNRRICFHTKGANNSDKDDYIVHPHQVRGKVVKGNKTEWNTERKLILLLSRVTFDEGIKKQIIEIASSCNAVI